MTIDNYEVFWNQGSLINTWASLTLTPSLTLTQSGLSAGETYSFTVRGINKYGAGPTSSATAIIAG